jgi:hypothetical protein
LAHEARGDSPIKPLILILFDYAIEEINQVNRNILCWSKWIDRNNGITVYAKLYGTEDAELYQKAFFLSEAHTKLDHTEKYHLKTVHPKLDYIIGILKNWFVSYKDREYSSRFYGLREFNKRIRDKYPKVFKELKRLIEIGVIKIPDWDKHTKKKVAKW